MAATPFDLVIEQGRTLEQVVRWETEPFLYAQIQSISNSAPVTIETVAPHGIPDGWRVAVVGAKGLTSLNSVGNPPKPKDFIRASAKTVTSIEFNAISTALEPTYSGGGALQFYSPASLAGCSARMDIKNKVGGVVLLGLTSLNGKLVLDAVNYRITILLSAAETAALTWKKGVYDLELESPSGVVTAILTGSVTVSQEVTT